MKHYLISLLALLFFLSSNSQQVQTSGWLASFNTFKLSNQFSLHFDAQLRSADEVKEVRTVLFRPGLNVRLNKLLTATTGYAFIANRTAFGGQQELLVEHRAWQQAIAAHRLSNVSVQHRVRFEERFLPKPALLNGDLETDGYNQAFRIRYFIRSIIPLVKGKTFTNGPFASVQNEVFLNTGNKSAVNGKSFDQNRLYGSVGYRLPKIDVEAGYMNQYINGRLGFTNNHIIQLAVYKRL